MIRYSPNSLVSLVKASRSSSTSGSYGHLSDSTLGPALLPGLPGHHLPTASMFPLHHPLQLGHSLAKSQQINDLSNNTQE
ncbi:hypothetical protein quinque_008186 [Culex quinquefasciatus]